MEDLTTGVRLESQTFRFLMGKSRAGEETWCSGGGGKKPKRRFNHSASVRCLPNPRNQIWGTPVAPAELTVGIPLPPLFRLAYLGPGPSHATQTS